MTTLNIYIYIYIYIYTSSLWTVKDDEQYFSEFIFGLNVFVIPKLGYEIEISHLKSWIHLVFILKKRMDIILLTQ